MFHIIVPGTFITSTWTSLLLWWVENVRKKQNLNFIFQVCFAAAVSGEADADAFYGVYGYGAVGAYPYATYAYAAPSAYAQVSPSASLTTVGLAQASLPAIAGGYAGAGRYVANSAGVVHVAKREAEAEADPALLYRTYGYAGYPYAGVYGAYAGYPYTYGYYGKRSAEAEPEADAALLYGAYAGYPYAYGAYSYGAYPYGYGYAWGK